MEEEIDLREYLRVLIRSWRLIAGVTLVALVVALVVSLMQPTVYEATASVAWSKATPTSGQPATAKPLPITDIALTDLALHSDVLQSLLADLDPPLESIQSVGALRGLLKPRQGSEAGTALLTARARDPQEAARIANAWAEALVPYAVESYRDVAGAQVAWIEEQVKQAQAQLAQAEQALLELDEQSQAALLAVRREAAEQELRGCLAEQAQIGQALKRARDLQGRLATEAGDARVQPADRLTAVMLQAQASSSGSPVQLELSADAVFSTDETAAGLLAHLERLMDDLEQRSQEVHERIAALEPQVLELQGEVLEAELARERAQQDRDVAREVYAALAQEAGRARVAAESGHPARIVELAAAPAAPSGRSRLFSLAVAGVLGVMLGVFGALAAEWWRGGPEREG